MRLRTKPVKKQPADTEKDLETLISALRDDDRSLKELRLNYGLSPEFVVRQVVAHPTAFSETPLGTIHLNAGASLRVPTSKPLPVAPDLLKSKDRPI